ncbi:MAG: YidC/Oxa1 family membrane protein insertase [Christensenella sp.]|nr:YidC/Oxa1 family membrane protein insertase [Christensenella sp.]
MSFLYNNFLSDFFMTCINGINSLVNDYALCIVIITILIRLCLLPLDMKQRNNAAKMSSLGPEIQSLQKRYANNPQQLQRKQQELYRKMNVKPMLGCLPAVIQLPILFAFFGAMQVLASQQTVALVLDAAQYGAQSVQLPEFFWVHNFWQPDNGMANILPNAQEFLAFVQRNTTYIPPQTLALLHSQGLLDFSSGVMQVSTDAYTTLTNQILASNGFVDAQGVVTNYNGYFILPALSGVALFLQQKFNPASMNGGMGMGANPEQAEAQGCSTKMMLWIFPIFSVYICATSNTAFALYWFTSSLYAFAQMKLVDFIKKARARKKQITVS